MFCGQHRARAARGTVAGYYSAMDNVENRAGIKSIHGKVSAKNTISQ
jgi:hypothetical protein